MADYNLIRFLEAQEGVYESVLRELKAGQKSGHWMWFVFPQIRGLGASPTARHYAIGSREEARAYSEHTVLGRRLSECTQIVLDLDGSSAEDVFQYPDVLKFRSCMTLFSECAPDSAAYAQALVQYFRGSPDARTLDILGRQQR